MSQQRRCDFTKAVDQRWYMTLGDHEHAYDDIDCTVYGPFPSYEQADQYRMGNFRNPGGHNIDDSGTAPVPLTVVTPIDKEDDELSSFFETTPRARRPKV